MKKIGVMGGTFNPIHNAHIQMAKKAIEQADLNCVLFIPTYGPPHKDLDSLVDPIHRENMVKLGIQPFPEFIFSDLELQRKGTTYTAHTLLQLHELYPEDSFYFILGGDSFFQLETWFQPEQIMKLCTLLPVSRDRISWEKMHLHKEYLVEKYHGKIQQIDMDKLDISSSMIRQRVALGLSIHELVPKTVQDYIQEHNLYHEKFIFHD